MPSSKHNEPLQAGEEIVFQELASSQHKISAHPNHLPSGEGTPAIGVYTNSLENLTSIVTNNQSIQSTECAHSVSGDNSPCVIIDS